MSTTADSYFIAGLVYTEAFQAGRSHVREAVSSALALTKKAGLHLDSSVFLSLALKEVAVVESAATQNQAGTQELVKVMTAEGRSHSEIEAVLEYLHAAARENVDDEAIILDAYAAYEAARHDPSLDVF